MRLSVLVAGLTGLLAGAPAALAQELAPRAYWPAPAGTNVLVAGYQWTDGDVLTDPSLPLEDAEVELDYFAVTYQRTFAWFGRTTNFQLSLPYVSGHGQATVAGELRERSISALADARLRVSINLAGAPAMDVEGFRQLAADPKPIFGASLLVSMPTGAYDADRVLNAGTNRWAVKPAVGGILPVGQGWFLEAEVGAWLYGENDDFLGERRKQDSVFSSEFHIVRATRRGTWVSLDANWYSGGRVTVGDAPPQESLNNSRAGFTFLYPFNRRHALRGAFSTGIATKTGGDFHSVSLSYVYIWR